MAQEIAQLAGVMVAGVLSYMFYQIARIFKTGADLDERETKLQEILVNRVAEKRGIDLDKEIAKSRVLKKNKKDFGKKLRLEMYEEMFGKDKEDKEDK